MFVTFAQNNSGGYFIQNEDVDVFVIIEGDSLRDILDRANDIFRDYSEYCRCCGKRWDDYYISKDDLDEEPKIYGKSVYEFTDSYYEGCKAIIYRKNGTKEEVEM